MPARIPQETLDEIMRSADILDIVGEYVSLQRKGRNYFGLCPFHDEDTPSFSVNPEKQFYKCFGCGEGGNVIGFLMKIENLTFPDAARRLAERYGITIPDEELSPAQLAAQQERQNLLAAHRETAEFYASQLPLSNIAQAYLKKRGIDQAMAQKFGLGYAPETDWQALTKHLTAKGYSEKLLIEGGLVSRSAKNGQCFDKFHGRLIFPIRDNRGIVIAFGGRALGDEQPKYLNSMNTPIYNKSAHLYALDLAANTIVKEKRIFIMEGYMDVLAAHQFGITNAVASLGTAFTDQQARLLNRLAPQPPEKLSVILAFDGDGAGAKAALASLTKLSTYDFLEPQVMVFPQKLDPDEFLRQYGMRGWQRLLDKYCYSRLDYLLLRTMERHDVNTASGKGDIVAELLPAIASTKTQTERESFIRKLARQLQVSDTAIYADLAKSGLLDGKKLTNHRPATKPQPKKETHQHPAQLQLLALAIGNQKIFDKAKAELADNFGVSDQERQLITLIESLGTEYDFHPNSLFNYLREENEGLRQFMLKLLETDITGEDPYVLADSCISIIKQQLVKDKIAQINRDISAAEANNEDCRELLKEKLRLSTLLIKKGEQ